MKTCCEGGKVTAGCYHDHCTGPKEPQQEFDFLAELDNMDTDYEVEKFADEEDDGCEGGACKI